MTNRLIVSLSLESPFNPNDNINIVSRPQRYLDVIDQQAKNKSLKKLSASVYWQNSSCSTQSCAGLDTSRDKQPAIWDKHRTQVVHQPMLPQPSFRSIVFAKFTGLLPDKQSGKILFSC